MKKFLVILVLCLLTLSTSSFADNIERLKVEGMQVGDTLLDYFSKSDIETNTINDPGYTIRYKDEFIVVYFHKHPKFLDYDGVQITLIKNDKDLIIHGIDGVIMYQNAMDKCYNKMEKIDSEFSKNLSKLKLRKIDGGIIKHPADPQGKSTFKQIAYLRSAGTLYGMECTDWADHMPEGYFDNFKFIANSQVLHRFLSQN